MEFVKRNKEIFFMAAIIIAVIVAAIITPREWAEKSAVYGPIFAWIWLALGGFVIAIVMFLHYIFKNIVN